MKKRVVTLLLGVLMLLSMAVDRAEASTILRVFSQNYTASGTLDCFDPFNCQNTFNHQTNSAPGVGDSIGVFPGDRISVSGTGNIGLSSGSLGSSVNAFGVSASGSASATMEFNVNTAAEISVNCMSQAGTNGPNGPASFKDATTSQVLLSCLSRGFLDQSVNSGTFSLNPTDTYVLSTSAATATPDSVTATINFSGDFLITTPEPSMFGLLGMALMALGLVRKRLVKERQAIR
jgi:hypothetical protein